jgi:hypothetical protein
MHIPAMKGGDEVRRQINQLGPALRKSCGHRPEDALLTYRPDTTVKLVSKIKADAAAYAAKLLVRSLTL